MLRTVLDEIVRRRLWPLVAVAPVAVAAPLLFLKSGPQDAASPAIDAAPAAQVDVPARARPLLEKTDASAASDRRLSRSRRDPFQPPATARAAKHAGAKTSSPQTATSVRAAKKLVEEVIKSAGGPAPAATATATQAAGAGGGTSPARPTGSHSATPARRTGSASSSPTVDVRFGAEMGSPIVRRVLRGTTFSAGGELVLAFVKWSPAHHKAVFAVAQGLIVDPDTRCRPGRGICRYVEIPVGKSVRVTFVKADGTRVSRRLDVVRVHRRA